MWSIDGSTGSVRLLLGDVDIQDDRAPSNALHRTENRGSVNLKEVNLEERLAAQKDDATANLYDAPRRPSGPGGSGTSEGWGENPHRRAAVGRKKLQCTPKV